MNLEVGRARYTIVSNKSLPNNGDYPEEVVRVEKVKGNPSTNDNVGTSGKLYLKSFLYLDFSIS